MGVKFDDLSQRQNEVMLTCFQPGDASESVWKYFQGSEKRFGKGQNLESKYGATKCSHFEIWMYYQSGAYAGDQVSGQGLSLFAVLLQRSSSLFEKLETWTGQRVAS